LNEILHVSDSSSVHYQEFSTVHTAMVYVIQVSWQLASSFGRKLYMFRTVSLSIIRVFPLYTQQWYMSYKSADSLQAVLKGNSTCFGQFLCPLSRVFYCTHSNGTCHTSLLTACEQFWKETLHISDSSSVHYQEFSTVHTAMVAVIQVCWQLSSSFGRKLCMFRTVPLSIIRSFPLYTQQWYMSYKSADSLRAVLERNSTCFGQFLCPLSGVFHCTHSNGICHTSLL